MKERRNFVIIMLGRGLLGVTAFAVVRLMTSVLSVEEVGRSYILLSLTAFFAFFLLSPIGMYVNRKTHDWYRSGALPENLQIFWLYLLAVAVFVYLVLLLIGRLLGFSIDISLFWLAIVVTGSLVFNTANVTVTTMINMIGDRLWSMVFTLLTLWVGLGFAFLFVTNIGSRAEYWLSGLILGQLLLFLVAYWYLLGKPRQKRNVLKFGLSSIPKFDTIISPVSFAWPLAITAVLGWVQAQSYRFVISYVGGLESLGLFAVGFGIAAAVMAAFYDVFSLYYYPLFYEQISTASPEGKRFAWNATAAYLFPAVIPMVAFTIACVPYLVKLLVAADFLNSEHFLIWGALSQFAFVLGAGFQMLAHAEMRTTWLIPPSITGAVVAVIGVFGLAQWNPQLGSGIALTLAGFAMVVHLALKLHKEVPFNLPWRRIFISLALSAPLLIVLLVYVNPLIGRPTYVQSIMVLAIASGYLLIVQYLIATRWLKVVSLNRGVS